MTTVYFNTCVSKRNTPKSHIAREVKRVPRCRKAFQTQDVFQLEMYHNVSTFFLTSCSNCSTQSQAQTMLCLAITLAGKENKLAFRAGRTREAYI